MTIIITILLTYIIGILHLLLLLFKDVGKIVPEDLWRAMAWPKVLYDWYTGQ